MRRILRRDVYAIQVTNACRRCGIAVPTQIAVLGVDNDPVICSVSFPPLSSIDLHTKRIGYEAAALLDQMMAGQSPPQTTVRVEPRQVVIRESTDVLAVEDADVAQAIRFIREFACRGINVQRVCKELGVSRRVLERRFHSCLNRAPKEEILRVQIDRAKSLLAQTNLSVAAVGKRVGFAAPQYFATVFRQSVGATPRQYRHSRRIAEGRTGVQG